MMTEKETHHHKDTRHHSNQHTHEHANTNDHNHKHDQGNGHDHCGHHHSEHDTKLATRLYILGFIAFILGLIIGNWLPFIGNTLMVASVILSGYHVLGEGFGDTIRDTMSAGKFKPNIHLLMGLAAVGALLIGSFYEAALLILIFAGAHFLEDYAEGRSRREITNLMNLNPTEALLLQADGSTQNVAVDQLQIGDQVQVLNGGQIPTDGRIVKGATVINEASINGESMPKEKTVGDEVFGATINGDHAIVVEVTKNPDETVFAKILQMVEASQANLTPAATKIKKIEPIYVTTVLAIFPFIVLLGPWIFGWEWAEAWYRGLIFLISASPCALAASAVPATLSAISNLARHGVLFKGGAYLSNLIDLKAIAFDKTGTLTKGEPEVTDYFFVDGIQDEAILPVVVAMESQSNHPLARAILQEFKAQTKPLTDPIEVTNDLGKGLSGTHAGHTYQIGKPSIFTVVPDKIKRHTDELSADGKTVVYIAKDDAVIGYMAMMDTPNHAAKAAIDYLHQADVHTVMITGDNQVTGQAVANQVGIDQVVANVLPEEKAQIVKDLQAEYGQVGMTGDGVNDAPALVQADIGFAMGDGTDVAIDVADVVVMANDLDKLTYAHQVSKDLNRITWQNMAFSMFVVLVLVILNFMGIADIALGVLFHEGSTILVILNGLRLLRGKRNNI